ncbi:MAG TPA: histidine kinase [Epulopiscium sp.]|nr:histidine kinase [Candidatus Epulonipiscium sp.]
MKKWINNWKLRRKLSVAYVVLALVPMMILTLYNFTETKELILKESYKNIDYDAEQTKNNIEALVTSYSTIMDVLYMDKYLSSYMVKDYTNESYWEMFSYIDKRLQGISTLIPDIKQISIYSTNKTIPNDNYYFYQKSDLDEAIFTKGIEANGRTIIAGQIEEDGKTYIILERLMNYYATGGIENMLVVMVDATSWNSKWGTSDTDIKRVFLDNQSNILIGDLQKDQNDKTTSQIIDEWNNIKSEKGSIYFEHSGKIAIIKDMSLETKLLVYKDQSKLANEAWKISRKILIIFTVISVFVGMAIRFYTRYFTERVEDVVYAAQRLTEGKFDYVLKDMGKDEIGQISEAFNTLSKSLQKLIYENYEKKVKIQSSELNLLQEQINPHFLYNALSVISSLAMREGNNKTIESVQYLSAFYRISLNKGRQHLAIAEELQLLKSYMKIQKLRFDSSVEITYDVSQDVLQYRMIKLILQPLVENAIHHGRKSEETVLNINVRIFEDKQGIIFEVQDDGQGMSLEKLRELKRAIQNEEGGYGLRNVNIRIKLYYGQAYGMMIESQSNIGTLVRVEIPKVI